MTRKLVSAVILTALAESAWGQEESYVNERGYLCGNSLFEAQGWWDADASIRGFLGVAHASAGQSIRVLGGDVIPAWGASCQVHDQMPWELTKGYYCVWMGPSGAIFPRNRDSRTVKGSFSWSTEFHDVIADVGTSISIRSMPAYIGVRVNAEVYARVNGTITADRVVLDNRDTWGESVGTMEFIAGTQVPRPTCDLRYGRIDTYGRISILGGQGYGGYGLPRGSYFAGVGNVRLKFAVWNGDANDLWVDDSVPAKSFVIWRGQ